MDEKGKVSASKVHHRQMAGLFLLLLVFALGGQGSSAVAELEIGKAVPAAQAEPKEYMLVLPGTVGKIDLNLADWETLELLPGIGESLAEKIICYREENGGFSSVEEIMKVSGIGSKKFEGFKDYIIVETAGG